MRTATPPEARWVCLTYGVTQTVIRGIVEVVKLPKALLIATELLVGRPALAAPRNQRWVSGRVKIVRRWVRPSGY
jgi:hypothetical protein